MDFDFNPVAGTFSIREPSEPDTQVTPEPEQEQPTSRQQRRIERRQRPEQPFDGSLTQADLRQGQNLNDIRSYMMDIKGVQYRDASPEEVVDDFMEHMRYFNANTIGTAGVIRYISNANEEQKSRAGRAYELYDQLGSVFANDGFYGAIEGIGDYVFAAATDPTNYIGAITGGLFKGASMGVTQAGRSAMMAAARQARTRAASAGATRAAADQAADEAARRTAARLAQRNVNSSTSRRIAAEVAEQERDLVLFRSRAASREAARETARKMADRRALYATTALDGTFAMLQDVGIQNVMLDVGVQESFSATQTALSSAFGLVGGAFQLAGRQARGASGMTDARVKVREAEVRAQQEALVKAAMDDEGIEEATKIINEAVDDWATKVQRGRSEFDPAVTPTDFIHNILFGEDKQGGLAKLFRDKGIKVGRNQTVSDVMTNVVSQLPRETLEEINQRLQRTVGINLGETSQMGVRLGDLLAKDINQSARTLNLASQFRRTLDSGVVHGSNIIDGIVKKADVEEAVAKEKTRMGAVDAVRYGQSVWRRLLVSSPATSAVNLAGFAQFYSGQSIADLISSTSLTFSGVAMMPINRAKGKEMLRMARVYRNIQAQKMRNLLDPYTTKDAYMAFLEKNKDVEKALFESFTGGVDRAVAKFGIDENAEWFQRIESLTEGANNLTGVRIQDTFTKSQMFMTELDKNLRLLKNDRTLMQVLEEGTLDEIDDQVVGLTIDSTLKSVFSKDYTTDDQALRMFAEQVENFSNLPGLGTILPFGRFFNNVIGYTHQWGPTGLLQSMGAIAKGVATGNMGSKAKQITTMEAFSRAAVGNTAIGLAMHYDEKRREKGLGVFDMETAGGTIIDAKNTFPLSLFLAAGRWANLVKDGEEVPEDLNVELLAQLAVGQFARDAEFGNDLINLVDTFTKLGTEESRATFDGIYRSVGTVAAGVTRPLDPINKLVGYMDNTDAARDLRQAEGAQAFTQSATRYVDNIFEAMFGRIEAISGEELRVATREGAVQDPNPMARVFGITVRPARTATEQAYSMANLAEYKASLRSNMPEYDNIFQTLVAPVLEPMMDDLYRSEEFRNGNNSTRMIMIRNVTNQARRQVREYMNNYSSDPETRITALRRRAATAGSSASVRRMARETLREQGIEADIGELGFRELQYYLDIVDYLDDYYKDRTPQ